MDTPYQRHLAATGGGGCYIPPAGGSQVPPVASSGALPPELVDSVLPRELQQALSEQDISALLSRQDLASSLAEDLLAQFAHQQHQSATGHASSQANGSCRGDEQQMATSDKLAFASNTPAVEDSKSHIMDSQFLAESEKWCKDIKTETVSESSDSKTPDSVPNLSINMTSEQVVASCKGLGKIYT